MIAKFYQQPLYSVHLACFAELFNEIAKSVKLLLRFTNIYGLALCARVPSFGYV